MHLKTFLLFISLAVTITITRAGENAVSKFTSTAQNNAVTFHREMDDPSEFDGLFRGFAGYDLEFVGGDERSWINIKVGKNVVDLREATMDLGAGIGFFPHKANDTVEWRGVETNGRFVPYAVIYRIVGLTENGKRDKARPRRDQARQRTFANHRPRG